MFLEGISKGIVKDDLHNSGLEETKRKKEKIKKERGERKGKGVTKKQKGLLPLCLLALSFWGLGGGRKRHDVTKKRGLFLPLLASWNASSHRQNPFFFKWKFIYLNWKFTFSFKNHT